MKKEWIASLVVVIVMSVFSGVAVAEEATALKTQKDKISYIIGMDAANNLKRQSVDIDPDIFMKGFRDMLSGNKAALSDDEIREAMTVFKEGMMKKHEEELKKVSEKNKKEGEAFLAENRKKEGVVTLPSGLQYRVIKEGDGRMPGDKDTVTVNYRGTMVDGTEFDSSKKRGKPASFPVSGVIAGWQEALKLMKVGSKWEIVVPAGLAYGEKGAGTIIGPNAALIFEMELLSIGEPDNEHHH